MAALKSVFYVYVKREVMTVQRCKRPFCSEVDKATKPVRPKRSVKPIKETFEKLFSTHEHIAKVEDQIPESVLVNKWTTANCLYLVDEHVAKEVVKHVLPNVESLKNHIVSESNPGLGFIASNLLKNGVKSIRLYESKPEFLPAVEELQKKYPERVDLINMSFFLLGQYEFFDKFSKLNTGTRMYHITKGLPKKSWTDDPVMTVIGAAPNIAFLYYLINVLFLQKDIVSYGRLQLFLFIKPHHFQKITASPDGNGLSCCPPSVLFNLFFDWELLDKYPRKVFLPWEHKANNNRKSIYKIEHDEDKLLFVKINFKEEFPMSSEHLLSFRTFVNFFIRKKNSFIIEELEKQLKGVGLNLLVPSPENKDSLAGLSIFTKFSELTPKQLLCVFKETVRHPSFVKADYLTLMADKATNDVLLHPSTEEIIAN